MIKTSHSGLGHPIKMKQLARLKVASHPKCDHFGKQKFYDSKTDLTPIFVLKKNFRKILFLQ